MCDPVTIAVVTTAAAGGVSAYSQYQQGVAESKGLKAQAQASEQQATQVMAQGQKQSELIQDSAAREGRRFSQEAARFNAAQRNAMAGMGVQGVTAEDILSDTAKTQRLDELAIRYNADVNSYETLENAKNQNWALRTEANQLSAASKNAKKAGTLNAFSTLLGTAANVAGGLSSAPKKPTSSPKPFGGLQTTQSSQKRGNIRYISTTAK